MSFADRPSSSRSRSYSGANSPMPANPAGGRRRHALVEVAEAGTAEVRPHEVRPLQVARRRSPARNYHLSTVTRHALRLHRRPVELHVGRAGRAVGRRRRPRRVHAPAGSTTTSTRCAPVPRSRRSRAGRAWRCCSPAPERLRGGVMVTGIPYRHPAVLANMAVTVDIASGGRLELGVGAGWFEPECEAYGIELGSITERFDRFEEALTVIRSLLTAADDDLRRALLPAPRRVVRAEGGPAAAPADRARRQGRATAAPARGPLRRPLELLRRRRRRSSAGCAAA